MKKILILLVCLCFTSCFEITERIQHHSDQSGTYKLVVDFSQSWLRVKSAMFLEEINGEKIPNEQAIIKKLQDFKKAAAQIEGISGVETKTNFDDYIFVIQLDYKNIAALNQAINCMDKQKTGIHFKTSSATTFERIASYPIPDKVVNDPNKKEDLEKANMIAIYSFATPIEAVNNSRCKISANKKTAFLKQSLYAVLKKSSLMNNTIKLTQQK
ncbi:hypothetical protein [Flavobacterium crassostreae]|uniref:Uncharacterized protein n=1 Tax=Flavobacterium crassostreae TaxID=1763534 RepID=A0A1B9E0F7_9FLAO|nr:hypothetical protein [Flavobacterium crassostreae]OCB75420.1 hypothetical protein LPBF_08490 [Flavobacterium crassostreae]